MAEKIRLVNAFLIHQYQDTDFALLHRHAYPGNTDYSLKDYIPEGEAWANHRNSNELPYTLKVEKEFYGLTGEAYIKKRLEIVKRLESKRITISKLIIRQETTPEGLLVNFVNDREVRRFIDPEFVQGGHGFVYSYIPKSPIQVWIAVSLDPRDYLPTINHECNERDLMADGMDYESAHQIATRLERSFRVAHGGSYASAETPLGFTPEQLRLLYFDLTK